MKYRGGFQKLKDAILFPWRAFTLPERDRWGLSSWASERFDYAAREVRGYCLDVGCGTGNRFIKEFLGGHGVGLDVYPYEGLSEKEIIVDLTSFPFSDETFDTVTFIAVLNHIPMALRPVELKEACRVMKLGGNIIVTMGNPFAEICAHKLLDWRANFLGEPDPYHNHGAAAEDIYYLTDRQIKSLLTGAGFRDIRKKYFWTQWGLNHLFSADKDK